MQTLRAPRPANPRILPADLDGLVISAEANIGAVAVTDFQGLVLGKTLRGRATDARAGLFGGQVLYPIEGGHAAPPEVAVQRHPGTELEIVAQMTLQGADGLFVLERRPGQVVERRVARVQPHADIGVEKPFSLSFRIAKLGFEGPTVYTPIHYF
jgi:hypothetical protein